MAWIESHQSLARHPKTIRFARSLNVSKSAAIGYLHMLWWWALDYAQDGDLSKYSADEIEAGAEWGGEPGVLFEGLKQSGYVDDDDQLHDWFDYAGKLISQREKDAERKRESRSKPKPDVRGMSGGRPADVRGMSVVPNQPTVPNQHNLPNLPNKERENAVQRLTQAYEETIGPLKGEPSQLMMLVDYMDKGMDLELIVTAIHKSSGAKSPLKYANSILKNQLRLGIKTVQQAIEQDEPKALKQKVPVVDDRYDNFYKLYPEMRGGNT